MTHFTEHADKRQACGSGFSTAAAESALPDTTDGAVDFETAIGEVLMTLQAERDDTQPDATLTGEELVAAEAATYQLLGELERLWHNAA